MKKNADRAARATKLEELVKNRSITIEHPVIVAPDQEEKLPTSNKSDGPRIRFVTEKTNETCLSASSKSIGALVFGSATRPGGGWRNGAVAQEEDVSLSSTWGLQAEKAPEGFYKTEKGWGLDNCLAAKGFYLFDAYGHELDVPRPCLFISIAAPNQKIPDIKKSPKEKLIGALKKRLLSAFNYWQAENIQTVVVGAIGCGVFEWDPKDSAEAYKRALQKSKFQGELVFALPDPTFREVFEEKLNFLPRCSDHLPVEKAPSNNFLGKKKSQP